MPTVLCVLAGCTGDRYFGDWDGRRRRTAEPDPAGPSKSPLQRAGRLASTSRPSDEPANLLDTSPESLKARDARPLRLAAFLHVVRAEVPVGAVSESYKVWNHLDEQAIGARRLVALKQNGLRVAVGRQEAWGPIKAILDGIPDRLIYRDAMSLKAGAISLEISTGPDDQTVFLFRQNGEMAGYSFLASHNLFQVTALFNEEDPSELILKVVPEIRQDPRKMAWTQKEGRVVRVPVYHGRTFNELAVQVTVPSGRFLVIGPGHEIEAGPLIGRALLTREVEGKRYESIFFLTPRVVRSGPATEQ